MRSLGSWMHEHSPDIASYRLRDVVSNYLCIDPSLFWHEGDLKHDVLAVLQGHDLPAKVQGLEVRLRQVGELCLRQLPQNRELLLSRIALGEPRCGRCR